MNERDLVDELYQMWAKTTAAGNGGWDIEEDLQSKYVDVVSIDTDEWEQTIGFTVSKPDADFITAVHSAFPELVRLFHSALDEADRADQSKDARECRIAELEVALAEELAHVAELKSDLEGLIAG
jgi:hypothetical protein